jgi:inward rectifier potassium channel
MLNFKKIKPYDGEPGFGKTITTSGRLMLPDGSFNVIRESNNSWQNVYFHLMTMPWGQFIGLMLVAFGVLNSMFALLYCMVGVEHFNGIKPGSFWENFASAFFFSSQTLTTVGYGHISPGSFITSLIASFESFAGLLTFALISGLLYGRFSRPNAKVVFSDNMLVAPFKDGKGLMFRMGNIRRSELIEAEVQIIASINEANPETGVLERRYFGVVPEYTKISFFSMSWTVVHPINDQSPLWGITQAQMESGNIEFMVLLKAIEEANQQMVHARHSYSASEIVWDAKFNPIMTKNEAGIPVVRLQHISDYTKLNATPQ